MSLFVHYVRYGAKPFHLDRINLFEQIPRQAKLPVTLNQQTLLLLCGLNRNNGSMSSVCRKDKSLLHPTPSTPFKCLPRKIPQLRFPCPRPVRLHPDLWNFPVLSNPFRNVSVPRNVSGSRLCPSIYLISCEVY